MVAACAAVLPSRAALRRLPTLPPRGPARAGSRDAQYSNQRLEPLGSGDTRRAKWDARCDLIAQGRDGQMRENTLICTPLSRSEQASQRIAVALCVKSLDSSEVSHRLGATERGGMVDSAAREPRSLPAPRYQPSKFFLLGGPGLIDGRSSANHDATARGGGGSPSRAKGSTLAIRPWSSRDTSAAN